MPPTERALDVVAVSGAMAVQVEQTQKTDSGSHSYQCFAAGERVAGMS